MYIDVHKAIRRLTPAPRARCGHSVDVAAAADIAGTAIAARKTADTATLVGSEDAGDGSTFKVGSLGALSDNGADGRTSPKVAVLMKRRGSVGPDGRPEAPIAVKASLKEMKQQLRLGPANRAAHPRNNTRNVFKIKQGLTPVASLQHISTLKLDAANGTPSAQTIASALHAEPEMTEPAVPPPAPPPPPPPEEQDESTPLLASDANGAATIKPYGANGTSKSKKNKKNGKKK